MPPFSFLLDRAWRGQNVLDLGLGKRSCTALFCNFSTKLCWIPGWFIGGFHLAMLPTLPNCQRELHNLQCSMFARKSALEVLWHGVGVAQVGQLMVGKAGGCSVWFGVSVWSEWWRARFCRISFCHAFNMILLHVERWPMRFSICHCQEPVVSDQNHFASFCYVWLVDMALLHEVIILFAGLFISFRWHWPFSLAYLAGGVFASCPASARPGKTFPRCWRRTLPKHLGS